MVENNEINNINDSSDMKSIDIDHIHTAFNEIPFYNRFYKQLKDRTHASETLLYSGMQFMLSLGAQNASVVSEMGVVRPNLTIVGIMPSGYSKSPMLNVIREVLKFWSINNINYVQKFETFSPEGVKSFLGKLSEEEKTRLYKMAILRDEASTLAKSTKNGMMTTNGIEFLSYLVDGRVEQHDTRTSEHETFPEEVYCPIWLTGTNGFWAHIINDWWSQGIGFRAIYPLMGDMDTRGIKLEYSPIPLDDNLRKYLTDVLPSINSFQPDEEFSLLYYQKTEEIRHLQQNALYNGKSEDIEIQYYKKYPELILKLAMIHRVAMMEKPLTMSADSLYQTKDMNILILTKEDFVWAEKDYQMFSRGFLQSYESYLDAQTERYKRVDTSVLETKFFKSYDKLIEKNERYDIDKNDYHIITNKKGDWVKLSRICQLANFNSMDKDMVIKSLLGKELIDKNEAINYHYQVIMVRVL